MYGGIEHAAEELVAAGRVHALGALVGGPAWAAAAAMLRRLARQPVDIGLHLDLTEFTLSSELRRSLPGWLLRASLGRVDTRLLADEIRCQLDRFETALGRVPAYVDGHQHVHQLPVIRELLLEELQRRYGRGPLPWLRSTRSPREAGRWTKARLVEHCGASGLQRLAQAHGMHQNERLLGVYDFRGGPLRYAALLQRWLASARSGDLLLCHASVPCAEPAARRDPLHAARCAEFEVLRGPAVQDMLDREGIVLAPMSRILHVFSDGECAEVPMREAGGLAMARPATDGFQSPA